MWIQSDSLSVFFCTVKNQLEGHGFCFDLEVYMALKTMQVPVEEIPDRLGRATWWTHEPLYPCPKNDLRTSDDPLLFQKWAEPPYLLTGLIQNVLYLTTGAIDQRLNGQIGNQSALHRGGVQCGTGLP